MLNIWNTNNNPFLIVGDVHGLFEDFCYFITKRKNISDVNVVVCGDFGVGFYKPNYYTTLFKKLNKKLKNSNVHIYAFRGNHDDPLYYSNKELQDTILNGVNYIHLVDDYDFIKSDTHNILCIGGARSIDKTNRWKWDYITQTKVADGWWEGEMVNDIPDGFDKFVVENNLVIDTICTHSSPDFCMPLTKEGLLYWSKYDDTLIEECDKERKLLTSIYERLKDKHNIKYWFYGHFHHTYILIDNDVLFRGINMFDNTYYSNDYYLFYE